MPLRTFTPEEIDTGLTALILIGDATAASRYLKEQNLRIAPRTLRGWRDRHADRLAQLEKELAPKVADRVAGRAEAVALRAIDVQARLIQRLEDEADELKPADAAGAARNLAVVAGIAMDKLANPIRGRPSVIHHTASPEELASRIAQALGFVDSTAEEEPRYLTQSDEPNPNAPGDRNGNRDAPPPVA